MHITDKFHSRKAYHYLSGYISTGSGSKHDGSNPQARKEGSSKIADDDRFINFNKFERITNLVAHCPYEFYLKKII